LNQTLLKILEEQESVFYNYRNLLTSYQWQLLTAIAKEKEVIAPTAKEFVSRYQLGTPSSIQVALKALEEKEMIFRDGKSYFVYDVFLSRWLERVSI
jgi:DNA-binding MarR family transcriptional regulator